MPTFTMTLLASLLSFFLLHGASCNGNGNGNGNGDGALDQTGLMWSPVLEWSVENPSYTGNPFDVIADVTFVHQPSRETRRTQMFYDGGSTWKWRFSGTQVGIWEFTTASDDPDLNGLRGRVDILPNPDAGARGFLTAVGSKYAMPVGNSGALQGYLFNVYMNLARPLPDTEFWEFEDLTLIDRLIDEAQGYGFNTIFTSINNNWFQFGVRRWDEHSSENPDLRTFALLDQIIPRVYDRGMTIHLWAWGDEERRWTQIGVGGINGEPDRRLQRYIAARMGPLPGWSMGYGFDLGEWVSAEQVNEWALFMHAHMGWEHLLFARGYDSPALSGISYSSTGPGTGSGAIQTSRGGPVNFAEVVSHIESDPTRVHFYEERFTYQRYDRWSMEATRRALWQYALAGGVGSFWGFFPRDYGGVSPAYPNPEQLRTFNTFWQGRFLLDMQRINDLTSGYALGTGANRHYVFYQENTTEIRMDLTGMDGPQPAYAVDTVREYEPISLGTVAPSDWTWTAPYASDWVIAVGEFSAP